MSIIRINNKSFPSNTYLLVGKKKDHCVIIDPGLDPDIIDEKIFSENLLPIGIVCTHGHFDHVGSVSFFQKKYSNIPFYLHEGDVKISQSVNFFLKLARVDKWIDTALPDKILKGRLQGVELGEFLLTAHHFPGHTDGSCIIEWEENLFTGDMVYKKGLGVNSFPGEKQNELKKSIERLLSSFPDSTMIFPGHGDAVTLCELKTNNTELMNYIMR
ncbi:MAG: MBL fold metallo-hydrolase [Chitinophagaceae bacterium]|nr:MBL fold metallo-hydrolase [Chitinophagaceae bacterium]